VHKDLYDGLTPAHLARFRGRTYRSRSEAKWALVLTALDVPFYYEPSHYSLPSGVYLPDFWLPTLDAYLEVKADNVQDPRYGELGEMRGKRVFLANADIPYVPHSWLEADVYPALRGHIYLKWPYEEADYMLAREAQGRINIVPIALGSAAHGNDPHILTAYMSAGSYRFGR
jgi:hypothetical protein